jgi:hypothetical protein
VSQAIVLLLYASVGHTGNPRPLLRQTEEVGPTAIGAAAWCFN